MSRPNVAQSFLAIATALSEAERSVARLPLRQGDRRVAERRSAAAREALTEAMANVQNYLTYVKALRGRS